MLYEVITEICFMNRLIRKQLISERNFREYTERFRKVFEEHQSIQLLLDPETGSILEVV